MDIVPQLLANSIIAGSTYALFALGFNLIYGVTKFVNMAHGAVGVAGAYGMLTFLGLGWPVWAAAVGGIFAAGVLGYISDKAIFSPLRRKKSSNLVLFLASLGLFSILQPLLAIFFGPGFKSFTASGIFTRSYEAGGAHITGVQLLIVACALCALAGAWAFRRTILGRETRAISDDAEVATIVGINTGKVIGQVFFLGSALAGFGGILHAYDVGFQPTSGLLTLLEAAIASIIGGLGNVYGGFVGAFLLAFAENFGVWHIAVEWKSAITLGVMIAFLLWRPQGIMKQ